MALMFATWRFGDTGNPLHALGVGTWTDTSFADHLEQTGWHYRNPGAGWARELERTEEEATA